MSNKQQLQQNNTKYASLIELLRGKAAGGNGSGSIIETCTITVIYNDADFGGIGSTPESHIFCSVADANGCVQSIHLQAGVDFDITEGWTSTGQITINNIVKNSILSISHRAYTPEDLINSDIPLLYVDNYVNASFFSVNQDGNIEFK